jgi:hypothetical protein
MKTPRSSPDCVIIEETRIPRISPTRRKRVSKKAAIEPDCVILEVRKKPLEPVQYMGERATAARLIFPVNNISSLSRGFNSNILANTSSRQNLMCSGIANTQTNGINSNRMLPQYKIPQGEPEPKMEPAMLKCAVCLELASEYTKLCSTTCGHIFCMECLESALKQVRKCPICRSKIAKKGYHPLHI